MLRSKNLIWLVWLAFTVVLAVYLSMSLLGDDKAVFLPGETTHGHYQIEMKCNACHSDAFGGGEVLQQACVSCHGKELKLADDSHPRSKFTNPRNADRIAQLDARQCVTCHSEHQPAITGTMGVSVPEDVCFYCHQDIADDRPSHTGMGFETCASAGCHNFHDNRALYEDFLLKHLNESDNLTQQTLPARNFKTYLKEIASYPLQQFPVHQLEYHDRDAPEEKMNDDRLSHQWSLSAHARSGVNCLACHSNNKTDSTWLDKPGQEVCTECHDKENATFLQSRHGMRLAQDLPEMQVADARLPMKESAHDKTLNCMSCHASHQFDSRYAAVEACLGCHDDKHSQSYKQSRHYGLWMEDTASQSTGVSCASCHLPRLDDQDENTGRIVVQHNQNDNLRPNEKMLREVCMNCHGLGFSIDSLADKELISNNFNGRPSIKIKSLDMVEDRMISKRQKSTQEGS